MKNTYIIIIFLAICVNTALAQQRRDGGIALNTGNALLFSVTYGYSFPAGDIADRFGNSNTLGGSLNWMTDKSNLIFGIDGQFLFGNRVKEDVLVNLRTPEGDIISRDGVFASVVLRQRAFFTGVILGKLFSLSKYNTRAGIRATISPGFFQHKIRIQDDSNAVPQVAGEYKKGYDRLTNGFAISEFIGYQQLDTKKLLNFYIGVELTQGFTQNRRQVNFDTGLSDTESRFDMLITIKAGWTLPFYFGGAKDEEIYY